MATRESPLALSQEFKRLSPPIIVIGMHRSGTSLAAGLLHIMGVYIDPVRNRKDAANTLGAPSDISRQNGYGEAVSFRLLNEAIMAPAGATWRNVLPFLAARDLIPYTHISLKKIYQESHASLKEEFLSEMPADYAGRWGWKDPRTSLTLPYWLEVFPTAKLLHVTRETEGVVKSLMSRAKAEAQQNASAQGGVKGKVAKAARSLVSRLANSPEQAFPAFSMLNREDCIRLADIYVSECMRYRESQYDYSEISYEEIIAAPEASVHRLIEMLQLEPSEAAIAKAVQFISRP